MGSFALFCVQRITVSKFLAAIFSTRRPARAAAILVKRRPGVNNQPGRTIRIDAIATLIWRASDKIPKQGHYAGYPVIFLIFLYNGLSRRYIFL